MYKLSVVESTLRRVVNRNNNVTIISCMFNVLSNYVKKSTTLHFSIENYWQSNRLITIKTEIKNRLIFTLYSRTRHQLIVPWYNRTRNMLQFTWYSRSRNKLQFTWYSRNQKQVKIYLIQQKPETVYNLSDTTEPETG